MLCIKRACQCTIFQTFECSNDSSPNSSCYFWNHKVSFIQILHHCSVSWKITPLYFFKLKLYVLSSKRAHRSENFRLLSGCVKFYQILQVIFETTIQFSSLFSVMRHYLYDLNKRVMQNLKKNQFVVKKNGKNLVNFDLSTEKSQ